MAVRNFPTRRNCCRVSWLVGLSTESYCLETDRVVREPRRKAVSPARMALRRRRGGGMGGRGKHSDFSYVVCASSTVISGLREEQMFRVVPRVR